MFTMFLAGVLVCWWAEARGNPIHQQLGVAIAGGNMEGKEVRFGIFDSALFATVTTDASCGAVNSMHDSFTPLGGLVPMFNIQTGEVIFGGVGAGLYGMLIFVILAVFIAGLMVGRTPEYLGKKIESYDIKMALLAFVILAFIILGFTAWASVSDWGKAGLNIESPADRLLRNAGSRSSYLVLPLFALANAGVAMRTDIFDGRERLMAAVIAGLVFGKPLGIMAASIVAVRLKLAIKPKEYSWAQLAGAAALAGIGFTMSLFIAGQAFPMEADFEAAKIAVLVASVLSAVIGVAALVVAGRGDSE